MPSNKISLTNSSTKTFTSNEPIKKTKNTAEAVFYKFQKRKIIF